MEGTSPKDCRNRCTKCLLPETYPNISFDERHLCNFCTEQERTDPEPERRKKRMLAARLEQLFERVRTRPHRGKYDCLVSYSGGKDSTYLLHLLKEKYRLNCLAYTCDTGFMSPEARLNIQTTIPKLKVDHLWRTPGVEFYKKLYRPLLMHPTDEGCMKTVCKKCFPVTFIQAVKLAMQHDIPLMALGVSPAQFNRASYRISRSYLIPALFLAALFKNRFFGVKLSEAERRHFHIPFRWLPKCPIVVLPFMVLHYDVATVRKTVIGQGLIAPGNEHPLRSNCHVNLLMMELDFLKYRHHSYAEEISRLVREGQLSRQEWLELEDRAIAEILEGCFERPYIDSVVDRLELRSWYDQHMKNLRPGKGSAG